MKIKIKFEPRDMWIGLYWNHRYEYNFEFQCNYIDYFICIIPCFPIHIHYDIHEKIKNLQHKNS